MEYAPNRVTEHLDMVHSNVALSKPNAQGGEWLYRDPDFNEKFHFYKAPDDMTKDWHVYGMLWDTDDTVTVYLDGKKLWQRTYRWVYKDGRQAGPAHILLNLAVGGKWARTSGSTTTPSRPRCRWTTSGSASARPMSRDKRLAAGASSRRNRRHVRRTIGDRAPVRECRGSIGGREMLTALRRRLRVAALQAAMSLLCALPAAGATRGGYRLGRRLRGRFQPDQARRFQVVHALHLQQRNPGSLRGRVAALWGNGNHLFYKNGILSLIAKKPNATGHSDSGMIRSRQRFELLGYFEARIELAAGRGVFPAFWLNSDYDANGKLDWPPEIDIMEFAPTASPRSPT